jgi:hypothetical protein
MLGAEQEIIELQEQWMLRLGGALQGASATNHHLPVEDHHGKERIRTQAGARAGAARGAER